MLDEAVDVEPADGAVEPPGAQSRCPGWMAVRAVAPLAANRAFVVTFSLRAMANQPSPRTTV